MCIRRNRVISARLPAFAAMLALLALPATAAAQNWPSRPLTLVVPFAAGGPSDVAGRKGSATCSASRSWWRIQVGGRHGRFAARRQGAARRIPVRAR